MTDLVKRLRDPSLGWLRDPSLGSPLWADTMTKAADEIEQLDKACKEWAEVSQNNYQRAKAAQAALEEHKQGAMEAIRLVGQSARNAGLWQGKAEGLASILTECVNDLESAINGKVHKESMEKLIDHARQAVDNLNK
jgi:hypothetical protein